MTGIFKAYDIRGIYPAELNEQVAEQIGKAFGTLKQGTVVVGCDVRESSPALKQVLVKGLISAGSDVIDIGRVTTPMAVFATAIYGNAGVIVTASHNPPQYNGLKFFDRGGVPISYEAGLADVEKLVHQKSFALGNGTVEEKNIEQEYKNFLLSKLTHNAKKARVIIDCFNGSGSKVAPEVLRAAGYEVVEIRCAFNGNYPSIGPDPSNEENLALLKQKVVEHKADIGFAYDGDGDRLAVVDSDGNVVASKVIFALLVEAIPTGSKVVYDILTSDMVVDVIRRNSSIPVVCRTGHTYITRKLLEEGAALAGEMSGHFYFKETFGADDALFASLKVLECLITKGIKLQNYAARLPKHFSDDKRIVIKPEEKWNFVDKLKDEFSKSYKIDTLDGVKVFFDKGWAVFRPSNTEPKISIAYESSDAQEFEKIKKIVEGVVERM